MVQDELDRKIDQLGHAVENHGDINRKLNLIEDRLTDLGLDAELGYITQIVGGKPQFFYRGRWHDHLPKWLTRTDHSTHLPPEPGRLTAPAVEETDE